jgi:hypothetical protein
MTYDISPEQGKRLTEEMLGECCMGNDKIGIDNP